MRLLGYDLMLEVDFWVLFVVFGEWYLLCIDGFIIELFDDWFAVLFGVGEDL